MAKRLPPLTGSPINAELLEVRELTELDILLELLPEVTALLEEPLLNEDAELPPIKLTVTGVVAMAGMLSVKAMSL